MSEFEPSKSKKYIEEMERFLLHEDIFTNEVIPDSEAHYFWEVIAARLQKRETTYWLIFLFVGIFFTALIMNAINNFNRAQLAYEMNLSTASGDFTVEIYKTPVHHHIIQKQMVQTFNNVTTQ